MERDSLDQFARHLTAGLSRRSLTSLAGLGLTSWLSIPDDLDAKKKKKKKKKKTCKPPETRCGKMCVNLNSYDLDCGRCGNQCDIGRGLTCTNGVCGCPAGSVLCSFGGSVGLCTNITNNNEACGGCDLECNSEQTCQNGVCVAIP